MFGPPPRPPPPSPPTQGGLRNGRGWQRQLLVPLHLRAHRSADCALAVELCRNPDAEEGMCPVMYVASTLLDLNMAYNNARLVNSVESPWLQSGALAELALENADLRAKLDEQGQEIADLRAASDEEEAAEAAEGAEGA